MHNSPRHILIVAATTGYQTRIFEETAHRLGIAVTMATDRCHHLPDPWGDSAVPVRFQNPDAGAETLEGLERPDGVIAVGDKPTVLAAEIAERLGLRFHPRGAVETCRNKFLAREKFREAGLLVPSYFRVPVTMDLAEASRCASYPCVLKPLGLSGSRGVIRANDEWEFGDAFERIRSILAQRDITGLQDEQDQFIQVESYIPGREFALEGLVIDGRLKVLTIFDKPDPLEGPYFEETIYVTPSREQPDVLRSIVETTERAIVAVGLTDGPVHAEMRCNSEGVWMLELAARPIGGLCAQAVRFGDGSIGLEELLIRFAIGEDVSALQREELASAVMMIPIPAGGIYHDVRGVGDAQAICDVHITAKRGQRLERLPEGSAYLGFLFKRSATAEEAEAAVRAAHSCLHFEIMPELPTLQTTQANY